MSGPLRNRQGEGDDGVVARLRLEKDVVSRLALAKEGERQKVALGPDVGADGVLAHQSLHSDIAFRLLVEVGTARGVEREVELVVEDLLRTRITQLQPGAVAGGMALIAVEDLDAVVAEVVAGAAVVYAAAAAPDVDIPRGRVEGRLGLNSGHLGRLQPFQRSQSHRPHSTQRFTFRCTSQRSCASVPPILDSPASAA